MALQLISFDEARYDDLQATQDNLANVIFCSANPNRNSFTDQASGATSVDIGINSGNMFLEGGSSGRHLFFTRFGNPGCPNDRSFARLIVRFSVAQQFVSFRLTSDFSGAGDAPVRVDFFATPAAPAGTAPLASVSIAGPFDFPPAIVFNQAGPGVREIRITSAGAENVFDELQFSDTAVTALHDVAAAFDGSGSMAAQGKWRAMIEAADLFCDLYQAIGDPADTFGGVLFRASGSQNLGSIQLSQRPAPGPLSGGIDIPALFAGDSPQGFTPIGEGVVAAGAMVQGGSNPNKSVLLLTDGINNRGRSVADAGTSAELQNVTIHTIGLGNEAQIDPVAISALAQSHGGQFRQTTNPFEIADFFAQALSQILGKAELASVTNDDVVVASGTTKAIFLAAWDVGAAAVDFDLLAPDGTQHAFGASAPAGPVSAISYHGAGATSSHSYFIVEGADLGGNWSFVNVPASARRLAVEDLRLRVHWSIAPQLGLTGEPIVVRARITSDGAPLTGKAVVRARIGTPSGSAGEILAAGGKGFKKPALQTDPNLRSAVAAKGLKALGLKSYPQRKDTAAEFVKTGPGEYELVFGGTELDGVYRFDLEAESESPKTPFRRRVSLFATLVSAPAQGGGSTSITPLTDGLVRVEVAPATRKKRPIGPFLGSAIRLQASHGKFVGQPFDHLDGRYSQVLAWDGKGALAISVQVLGKTFKSAKPKSAKPAKTAAGKGRKR